MTNANLTGSRSCSRGHTLGNDEAGNRSEGVGWTLSRILETETTHRDTG